MYNRAKGIAVTEGIVASGGEVGKDAYGFLREAVAKALSSPAARAALGRCGNFMEFEKGTREALREGASAGTSRLLTEADAEREPLRCGDCRRTMVRRSRPLAALWLPGRLRVVRGYWTCGCAKGGRCPLDEELGVKGRAGTRATPGLVKAVAPLAAETAFAPAAALASRLLGFAVNAKWMERMAKRLGSEMAAADASEEGVENAPAPSETMCCGIDGTGVPVRPGELPESRGKDGGKARTREAKVAAFFTGDGATRRSAAVDSAASRDTDAEPSAFAARLWREARRSGFAAARVKAVLGDGARWIWAVASELFPGAVEIVDLWHAKEHVWEVGRSACGAETALCEAWSKKTCAALSEGRLDDVLAALRRHAGNDEALRCAGYVEANRARMRYPEFRAAGLPVGSGVVESACGAVAGRLKRGGMRWSVESGANPMLALRCRWLDGRHDEFFKARARPPPLALAAGARRPLRTNMSYTPSRLHAGGTLAFSAPSPHFCSVAHRDVMTPWPVGIPVRVGQNRPGLGSVGSAVL